MLASTSWSPDPTTNSETKTTNPISRIMQTYYRNLIGRKSHENLEFSNSKLVVESSEKGRKYSNSSYPLESVNLLSIKWIDLWKGG